MAESFENKDNILREWAKKRCKKGLVEALNRYEKQEEVRKSHFFWKKSRKNYLSSLNETKPKTKLILLCLEFNKFNKQNVCYINLFKKFIFS